MNKYLLLLAVVLMSASCGMSKKYVYLQDMEVGEKYAIEQFNQAVVHAGDKLDIVVTCKNPELAIPFNIVSGTSAYNIASGESTAASGTVESSGYRVDDDGYIQYPILGRLRVEGMTLMQVRDLIKKMIVDGGYILDPTVSIEFLNFKYIVWGATGNGVFTVDGDKISIIEAIAKAGDIADNGRVDNVMVLREINGYREIYKMDLRTKDVFNSPGYYLQQNDVVYVEPKRRSQTEFTRNLNLITTTLSAVSTISTFLLLVWNLGLGNK